MSRYRVKINGFTVVKETYDDQVDRGCRDRWRCGLARCHGSHHECAIEITMGTCAPGETWNRHRRQRAPDL